MFKDGRIQIVQIWSHPNRSNMVAPKSFKYGRTQIIQIWQHPNRSNMVALELEHRTLKEWLRTDSPRVDNDDNPGYYNSRIRFLDGYYSKLM